MTLLTGRARAAAVPKVAERAPLEFSYFPGCSLHATAREYDRSTREVCRALGIDLQELEDWNCCGSTSAHSLNGDLARLLPLRNLEIAERSRLDLVIPCAACFSRTQGVATEAGRSRIRVRHIVDVLSEEPILTRLRKRIAAPLTGLRAVCYYGCLLTRPPGVTGVLDFENPAGMDRLTEAAGATALDWSYKTECCGASLTLTRPDVVVRLVDRLLSAAAEAGAQCVVVACSMCQANLDTRQAEAIAQYSKDYRLPVFYVTELLGLAMGLPAAGWWKRHVVDPRPLLSSRGRT